jgi:predicted P-loop ATPase
MDEATSAPDRPALPTLDEILNISPQAAAGSDRPASFQALIEQMPEGWKVTDRGIKPSALSPGHFAILITESGAALRFNEMELMPQLQTRDGWTTINGGDLDSAWVILDQLGWRCSQEAVKQATLHVARQTPVHPVRDWLLKIEQNPEIKPIDLNTVGPRFFRASDPLHAQMVRSWLVGAVSRVMQPGCKLDYCLVLQGAQGLGKSTALMALAGDEWFTSSHPDNEKDFLLVLKRSWIMELAELDSITSKKDAGALKNLITTPIDLFRVPYGKAAEQFPRTSALCATVNEEHFLRDDTGSRRFWIVPITGTATLDRDAITTHRAAIWKAALAAYRAGELPMLPREAELAAADQNTRFNVGDPWAEMVMAWMDGRPMHRWDPERDPTPISYDPEKPFTSAEALYAAGLKRTEQITKQDEMRLSRVLKALGFEKKNRRVEGHRAHYWASQPSQPVTTTETEVVTGQTDCSAGGLPTPSQPSQPIDSLCADRKKVGPGESCREKVEKKVVTPGQVVTSVAAQSVCPSQPQQQELRQVMTPRQVVTPAAVMPAGSHAADEADDSDDPHWPKRPHHPAANRAKTTC